MLREVLRVIKYIALHYITLANDTVTIGKVIISMVIQREERYNRYIYQMLGTFKVHLIIHLYFIISYC